jgi:hypothetical protein
VPCLYHCKPLPSFDELCQYVTLYSQHTTIVKDDLLVIYVTTEEANGKISNRLHFSIFKSSWDSQTTVMGALVGPYSFHLTDLLNREQRIFYQACPFPIAVTIHQDPLSSVTFPMLWQPENDVEKVLYQVLGIRCRVE